MAENPLNNISPMDTGDVVEIKKKRDELNVWTRRLAIFNIVLCVILLVWFIVTLAFTPFNSTIAGYGLYLFKMPDLFVAFIIILGSYVFINPPKAKYVGLWQRYALYGGLALTFANIFANIGVLVKGIITISSCTSLVPTLGSAAVIIQPQFWINADSSALCDRFYGAFMFLFIWNCMSGLLNLVIFGLTTTLAIYLDDALIIGLTYEFNRIIRKHGDTTEVVKAAISHRIGTKIFSMNHEELSCHLGQNPRKAQKWRLG